MKALKEKRVSLRSVFRRGLVILSLFALAFASCSDSGGGDNGDTGPTNGGTGPTNPPAAAAKFAEKIQVIKHPNMYSFEAAAPDLTGLTVAVYWNEGGATSVEIVEVKAMDTEESNLFYVEPPVAWVKELGTSVTDFSEDGDYLLYYNGVTGGAPIARPVNLYLPAVRALNTAGTAHSDIKLGGKIAAVYEDQLIDTSTLKIIGNYVDMPGGYDWKFPDGTLRPTTAGTNAVSTIRLNPNDAFKGDGTAGTAWTKVGRAKEEFTWDGSDRGIKEAPLSSRQELWELTRDPDDPVKKSTLKYVPGSSNKYVKKLDGVSPISTSAEGKYLADVGYFYYVDKLQYLSGVENLRNFVADEEYLSGPVDWLKELTAANIRFKVIYYTGKNQDLPEATREIGMNEYIKAMYALDPNDMPRATYPMIKGSTARGDPYAEKTLNNVRAPINDATKYKQTYISNSIIGAVKDDFVEDAVVQCLYYYTNTQYGAGDGEYNPSSNAAGYATSGKAWPNAAVIPLDGKIFEFDRIEEKRIKNTESLGNPESFYGTGTGEELLKRLKTYWDVVWVYTNGSIEIESAPIPWRTTVGANTATDAIVRWSSTAGDANETEEVTVYFAQPWSEGGQDDIDFEYDIKPQP